GLAPHELLNRAREAARGSLDHDPRTAARVVAERAALMALAWDGPAGAGGTAREVAQAVWLDAKVGAVEPWDEEKRWQGAALRDLFLRSDRPATPAPSLLAWQGGLIRD